MRKRRKMNKRASKNNFRNGTRSKRVNTKPRPMRGGIRM